MIVKVELEAEANGVELGAGLSPCRMLGPGVDVLVVRARRRRWGRDWVLGPELGDGCER